MTYRMDCMLVNLYCMCEILKEYLKKKKKKGIATIGMYIYIERESTDWQGCHALSCRHGVCCFLKVINNPGGVNFLSSLTSQLLFFT